ncbi:MAG TPA: hypothetical protein VGG97_10025 [Bryobacteraceae bacterium]|jgi:hypothetical protein
MAQTSLVKVTFAFVAGIVVALGSALIYVKVSEAPAPHGVLQIAANSGQGPEKMEPSPTVQPPVTSPAVDKPVAERPQPAASVIHRKHLIKKVPAKPVEIAQRTPAPMVTPRPVYTPAPTPPAPAPKPVSTRAVNETPAVDVPHTDAPPAAPQPHVVTLQPGTTLAIRLGETLSTEHNYTGDTFRGTLDAPIIIDGFIIADRGSKVLGRISNAQQAGRMEGRSNLTLALTEINTTDGQRVQVETSPFGKQGGSNAGENAAKMAGGAALGAIIGAIGGGGKGAAIGAGVGGAAGTGAVLLTHGKPVVLTAETQLSFQLSKPTVITEKLN